MEAVRKMAQPGGLILLLVVVVANMEVEEGVVMRMTKVAEVTFDNCKVG